MAKKKLLEVDVEVITSTLWQFTLGGSLVGRHAEPVQLEVGAGSDLSMALAPASPCESPVTPCAELKQEVMAGLSRRERTLVCKVVNQLEGVDVVTFGEHSVTLRLSEPPSIPEELEVEFVRILCEAFHAERTCVHHANK